MVEVIVGCLVLTVLLLLFVAGVVTGAVLTVLLLDKASPTPYGLGESYAEGEPPIGEE